MEGLLVPDNRTTINVVAPWIPSCKPSWLMDTHYKVWTIILASPDPDVLGLIRPTGQCPIPSCKPSWLMDTHYKVWTIILPSPDGWSWSFGLNIAEQRPQKQISASQNHPSKDEGPLFIFLTLAWMSPNSSPLHSSCPKWQDYVNHCKVVYCKAISLTFHIRIWNWEYYIGHTLI